MTIERGHWKVNRMGGIKKSAVVLQLIENKVWITRELVTSGMECGLRRKLVDRRSFRTEYARSVEKIWYTSWLAFMPLYPAITLLQVLLDGLNMYIHHLTGHLC